MASYGDTILVYGFDLENLPDISSRIKPYGEIISFLENETNIKSFPKQDAEDHFYIGVEVVSFNSESDIFQGVEDFNEKLLKNEKDYKLEIQHLITKIINDINRYAVDNMDYYLFTEKDIDDTIDFLEGLKSISPSKLCFRYC